MDLAFLVMLALMMLLSQRVAVVTGVPLLVRNLPVEGRHSTPPSTLAEDTLRVAVASPLRQDIDPTVRFARADGADLTTLRLHLTRTSQIREAQTEAGRALFRQPVIDALRKLRRERLWRGSEVVLEVASDVPFVFVNQVLGSLEDVARTEDILGLTVSYRLVYAR